ncbi:putative capsid and scaffold protein [Vibrio phage 393E50-1]|nr:putative capsid and scaffold protein [Vibrio phage 393E50-1]
MFSDEMINYVAVDGSVIGYAVEIEFDDNDVTRAHSGTGNVLIDGQIYYGVGELGSVGMLESVGDSKPSRLNVELAGIPGSVLSDALKAKARGRPAKLMLIAFDPDTGQLAKAEIAITGFVADYSISTGSDNKVSVTIADEFELFEMPWYKFWTNESHQLDHPGDAINRYVAQMPDREIQWGSKNDAPPLRYE